MTDRLTLALREFETLWPEDGRGDARVAPALSHWIERSACEAIEDLWPRPDFRRLARWSHDNLSMGARTEERKLVEKIDQHLVEAREATAELFTHHVLQEVPKPKAVTSDRPRRRQKNRSDEKQVDFADEHLRPWHDLVAVDDYFGPARDLNLSNDASSGAEYTPCADCLPYFNTVLRPLGDFVIRMLFVRVKFWMDELESKLIRRRKEICLAGLDKSPVYQRVHEALNAAGARTETLRVCCTVGEEPKLRNACTGLVQVYAAYRPQAELVWLGAISRAAHSPTEIRYRLDKRRDVSVALQVCTALREVASLANTDLDPREVCKEKSRTHDLLIWPGGHERGIVYWRQKPLAVDWFAERLPWLFLLALARRALRDQSVGPADIEDGYASALKHLKSRLKKLLPQSLANLIDSVGDGRYELLLDAEKICVLEQKESITLVELGA